MHRGAPAFVDAERDDMSMAAIVERNYGISKAEQADYGALFLFLEATIAQPMPPVVSWHCTSHHHVVRVELRLPTSEVKSFEADDIIVAFKRAVEFVVLELRKEMPSA